MLLMMDREPIDRSDVTALVYMSMKPTDYAAHRAGPANAGTGVIRPLSRTFGPTELYARGRRSDPARPSFLNFGVIRIAADGALTGEIRDADGQIPNDDQGRRGTLTPAR